MTETAYIGIGSNLGDKLENCLKSIDMIGEIKNSSITAQSDFFRTAPVGVEGHDWYVNAVICLETRISARLLLKSLLAIESRLGRKRNKKWDSRIIDLDILLFGQKVIDEKHLTVPHPLMHLRKFVLVPMVQLASNLIHPVLNLSMVQLLENINEEDQLVTTMRGA